MNDKVDMSFYVEEWEHILTACEIMSCGYERTDEYFSHCCDLNESVEKIREMLNKMGVEREGSHGKRK